MTQNEVSIVKNSVLDSTEAYVEARLSVLDFVRTQIGVVQGEPVKGTDKKYRHIVKCNATSNTSGITYNNVLSVGNIPFPKNSVVFLIAPNAQYSNQFILGKLDDTPCNISAGSIRLGGTDESNAPIYLSGTPDANGSYGHIGGFRIQDNRLQVGDALLSPYIIGCGLAGYGLVNLVGNQYQGESYLQLSVSGTPTNCLDGIRIFASGKLQYYDGSGNPNPNEERYLNNIPIKTVYEDADTGYLRWG